MNRGLLGQALLVVVLGAAGAAAWAQPFPNRPIRIVVPFPPGGPSDYAARVISAKLPEFFGQQVIVDNRPGASGTLGAEQVARAAPDGYTTVIANLGMLTILPHLQKKMPYDPFNDFTPITNLIGGPSFLLTHPSIPANNVAELIAIAKKRPGQLTYASASVGQISHMNGELMKLLAGIDMLHVPYKGTGPIMPELIGGQVSMTFSTSVDTLGFAKAGRVRLLAVTGAKRLSILPDTPTMAESGLPGFESLNWNGIVGPAKLPRDIVERLNQAMVRALNQPDVKEKVAAQGNDIIGDSPESFAKFIRAESAKWGRVVKQAGIKLE
ncbi:MAG: tripartite tricarboxylate transporter substrate binding protein [Burkholderiales bacterium]|nr:tripartite tricarboxylate transporter substrate binding protein [Burkholderiales bacterium]